MCLTIASNVTTMKKLLKYDFETLDDLIASLPHDLYHLPRIWMTEEEIQYHAIPSMKNVTFSYDQSRTQKLAWLQHIRTFLGLASKYRMQICWSELRYKDLHNICRRFGAQRQNYLCDYMIGDGSNHELLGCVRWKSQFCDDQLSLDDKQFWASAVYLYRTTCGKIRCYNDKMC
jgi:hypothetical protein